MTRGKTVTEVLPERRLVLRVGHPQTERLEVCSLWEGVDKPRLMIRGICPHNVRLVRLVRLVVVDNG